MATKNTDTLSIRLDKKLKQAAKETAAKLGIPLSAVVTGYLHKLVREQEFNVSLRDTHSQRYADALEVDAPVEDVL